MNDFMQWQSNRMSLYNWIYHSWHFMCDWFRFLGYHIDSAYANNELPPDFNPPNIPPNGRNGFSPAGGGGFGGSTMYDTSASGLGNINSHGTLLLMFTQLLI